MKTVELFQFNQLNLGSSRHARVVKNSRAALQLVRHGAKGANPVAAWVDAAISVADAINSYCKLQRAKAITEQLQARKQELTRKVANASEVLAIKQNLWQLEQQHRLSLLETTLEQHQQHTERLLAQLKSQHKSLEMLLTQVRALRRQSRSSCPRLTTLTHAADALMQAQLACLVYALNEPSE
ncbi:hypothetical protein [Ferrimonas sp. SCSIO 43195]|uniref:hypothetical protein n=1 Tax=Ferrimonas sp. SCSIO 43195 TaxID=2822844 RepID=UPI002075DB09|nr:hypothetical protein [Ferrimonas sp. SCSIO 43195]USD36462.1 hypothetical protein J8Z22_15755 [Ferrimonas sp. SCSIO 43195]